MSFVPFSAHFEQYLAHFERENLTTLLGHLFSTLPSSATASMWEFAFSPEWQKTILTTETGKEEADRGEGEKARGWWPDIYVLEFKMKQKLLFVLFGKVGKYWMYSLTRRKSRDETRSRRQVTRRDETVSSIWSRDEKPRDEIRDQVNKKKKYDSNFPKFWL